MKLKIIWIILGIVLGAIGIWSLGMIEKAPRLSFGGDFVQDTIQSPTFASITVNTTSTQVAASISRFLTIENKTTATLYCKIDEAGTTAASSTVTSTLAYTIGSYQATSTSNISPVITFGECWPGAMNCKPHKGAVNCLATSGATVNKISK